MTDIQMEVVAGKLNRVGYDAFIQSLRQAKTAGNNNVELAHWLFFLLQNERSDIALTADHFKLDRTKLMTDIANVVNGFKANQTEMPGFSEVIVDLLDRGWHYATLFFGETQIRSGHVLLAALKDLRLARAFRNASAEFQKIDADTLSREYRAIWENSVEDDMQPMDGSGLAPREAGVDAPGEQRGSTALSRFAQDLTAEAESGKMDPIVGRDDEIRQIIDVLMRRRQNNPIVVGEAGVGKTAAVEGFAQYIAAGNVPDALKDVRVYALDIGLLQAGASMKGEFEQRLRSVIDEVQGSPVPIILFIDEVHTLIGAGGQAGTGDAANLLKPALARGTLRTIGATTWSEYRQHIEKDPALTRRFQPVMVDEPDVDKCCMMLRGILKPMEEHHKVRISDEAVVAAVSLSKRYIPARQLPDKAVSLLDTACARVAISQATKPAQLQDFESDLEALSREKTMLEKDAELGMDRSERLAEIAEAVAAKEAARAELEDEWSKERGVVDEILELRTKAGEGAEDVRASLADRLATLESIHPERRMIYAHVDEGAVASVVSDWTGIPIGKMVADEIETILNLTDVLNKRVIGQDHGLRMISKRVETARAKLDNPNKPIGVFMLCGPSGVGKTETALAVAEALYGGEQNVITINMSEYQEAHTVSSLKGAPPGYVGYGEGGKLTEAVRRKPYSVVLLDEVEKAHPDVHEVFFQVFDMGMMEDGTGRLIDFKNTLIMLTSNVGTDLITGLSRDPFYKENPEELAGELREELLKVFPAALLGRMVTIPYYPLDDDMMAGIVRLHLGRVERLVWQNQRAEFVYDDDVVDLIVSRCNDPSSGGRIIDAIITNTMLPRISQEFLKRAMHRETLSHVRVGVVDGEFAYAFNGEPLPEPTAPPPQEEPPAEAAAADETPSESNTPAADADSTEAPQEPEPTPGE